MLLAGNLTAKDFDAARSSYSYVPAHLVSISSTEPHDIRLANRWLAAKFPKDWARNTGIRKAHSSIALDLHHYNLLTSNLADDLLHGLFSVVVWGFASGKNGAVHRQRAVARAKWVPEGRQTGGKKQV